MHSKEENKVGLKDCSMRCNTTPSNYQLSLLNLQPGYNRVKYSIKNHKVCIDGSIFLWNHNAHIVICDVDGTITKSDVGGHIMPIFGNDWVQPGITKLLTTIHNNGYEVLYLSSRSVAMSTRTKKYLTGIKQDSCTLPDGPIVMSSHGILASLTLEVIRRKPQQFKIPVLLSIQKLFPASRKPFYAAYGNRDTDIISYISAGIKVMNVYIINKDGTVKCKNKISPTSYIKLIEHIEELFPKLNHFT